MDETSRYRRLAWCFYPGNVVLVPHLSCRALRIRGVHAQAEPPPPLHHEGGSVFILACVAESSFTSQMTMIFSMIAHTSGRTAHARGGVSVKTQVQIDTGGGNPNHPKRMACGHHGSHRPPAPLGILGLRRAPLSEAGRGGAPPLVHAPRHVTPKTARHAPTIYTQLGGCNRRPTRAWLPGQTTWGALGLLVPV